MIVVARFNVNGSLDDGAGNDATPDDRFGTNGTVSNIEGGILASALQNDGKIVIVGRKPVGEFDVSGIIARLNFDGSLDDGSTADTTPGDKFRSNGLVVEDDLILYGVTIQQDGSITAAGGIFGEDELGLPTMVALRLNADGTFDGRFGNGGRKDIALPGIRSSAATALLIQGDGKLLLAGVAIPNNNPEHGNAALVRLKPNGSLGIAQK